MKSRIVWWILTVCCACAILTLSLLPAAQSSKISAPVADWIIEQEQSIQQLPPAEQPNAKMEKHEEVRDAAHIVIYVALSLCVGMLTRTYNRKWWYGISVPVCAVFGCVDELLQHLFAANRQFQLSDVWRDWLGTVIGTVIVVAVHVWHKSKQEAGAYGVSGTGA